MIIRTFVFVSLALGAGAAGEAQAGGRSDQVPEGSSQARHVPDEVLVQFATGASEQQKEAAAGRVGGARERLLVAQGWRHDEKGDLELLRIPPGLTVAQAIGALELDGLVEFAEPNWIYGHQDLANDPLYTGGSLWGMYGDSTTPANAHGSQAGEAWAAGHTGSSAVFVGVIDEGIMYGHEDLAGQVWTNPFDPVDGLDNDGNGYVDDVHGWDFSGDDASVYDGTGDSHGTHVAGTIGAQGGNGKGVAGVNWEVTLISAKFLGRRGGTTANAVRAVNYVTDLKRRHGLPIVATNNSWGGGGYSRALLDAIDAGGDQDILFVAAAGNGGRDGVGDDLDSSPSYPASYECTTTGDRKGRGWDCVISVAAIGSSGGKAGFSNYGSRSVDLGAPGVGIASTLPGKRNGSGYGSYSGTSMATPHVTGGIALYAATNHAAATGTYPTARQIREAIMASALPTASLSGKTVTGGRLNVGGF